MLYSELSTNPVAIMLQLLGGRWKILIIQELLKKEKRFNELKNKLGCTAKVLTATLRELENDGIIVREQCEECNKVEYYLTDIGWTLCPVIQTMQKWGKDYKKLRKLMEARK